MLNHSCLIFTRLSAARIVTTLLLVFAPTHQRSARTILAARKRWRRVSGLGSELDLLGTNLAKGDSLPGESLPAEELAELLADADDPWLIESVGETGECESENVGEKTPARPVLAAARIEWFRTGVWKAVAVLCLGVV